MRQHTLRRDRSAARLRRTRLCTAVLAVLASAAHTATAADAFWTGQASQDWFNGANWSPAGPPAPGDDAVIDTNAPNATNVIGAAAVLRDLTVGRDHTGTLQIAGVGGVSSRVGRIGEAEGSLGAVVVAGAGSVWSNSQNLFVGIAGTGSLNIINGGQVLSNGVAGIGLEAGSDGNVLISGAGSSWTNGGAAGSLIVGGDGFATVSVVNGGTLDNAAAVIGGGSGEGQVLVSGAASVWTSSGSLTVGNAGSGRLEVVDGGQVTSTAGVVGNLDGSLGEVVVEGVGSNWSMATDLLIGAQGGTGLLRIQDGGTVTSDGGSLGHFGGTGAAELTGFGSSWTLIGELTVGRGGSGSLAVGGGAVVTSAGGVIGELAGASGEVTVTGVGTSWNHGGGLVVGGAGSGSLTVSDGAQLIAPGPGNGIIGAEAGGVGEVRISGADWSLGNGALYVGLAGTGSLHIDNGGTVSNSFAGIGDAAGSQGEVTVTGGSLWTSTANLVVGGSGAGRLDIDAGSTVTGGSFGFIGGTQAGAVTVSGGSALSFAGDLRLNHGTLEVTGGSSLDNANARVGILSGVDALALVSGPGTVWTTSGLLEVGVDGQGTLAISDGGTVDSRFGVIGATAGGQGLVSVTGPDARWILGEPPLVGNALTVGNAGTGHLHIADGGSVLNAGQLAIIGVGPDAEGRVSVVGPGSSLLNDGALWLAVGGSAELAVADGALAENVDAFMAMEADAVASASVSGGGSLWRSSGGLFVGQAGTASLSVTGGGRVENAGGAIGAGAGSVGEASVGGAGSLWATTGQFAIGGFGEGSLRIEGGGAMSSDVAVVGASAGGVGAVTVSGTGSRWNIQSSLSVGSGGTGSLVLEAGGALTGNGFVWIGGVAGGEGVVTVRGPGSQLAPGGSITVGRQGHGRLVVSEGGVAGSGGTVFLGQLAGATGELAIGASPGETAAAPGLLDASVLAFGDGTATLVFNHSGSGYRFDVPLSSVGGGSHAIDHRAGDTVLDGDSSGFTGLATVSGGTLRVDGSLGGSVVVEQAGVVGGNGSIGSTTVGAGGTLAPGASIGTLTVDGDLVFEAGSVYAVELDLAGDSDLLAVTGAATLAGGAVATLPLDGIAILTPYTILEAAGGVAGAFDAIVLDSATAFLSPTLDYLPGSVLLTLVQSASFDSVALTPNQAATAVAADALGNGAPVWDAIVVLDAAAAQEAFDALSGEIHASAVGALVEDSRHLRDGMLDRLHAATGAGDDRAFWVRGFGARGRVAGDGNAARLRSSVEGLLVGGDLALDGGWRLGAALGLQRGDHDVRARGSSADVDSTHLGVYAARQWEGSALRLGAAYSWHRVEVDRSVAFEGFQAQVRSRYDAETVQAFGEYAHRIERDPVAFEPFASLGWVRVDADGFQETGGVAALSGRSDSADTTFATLGVRLDGRFGTAGAAPVTLHGRAGWQHAFSGTVPRVRSRFAGGEDFLIAGVPLPRNSAVIDAGLGFALSPRSTLDLSYAGRFGSGLRENAVRVSFTVGF
ncbi:MAG: autotransporter domain-containing protein [Lysobacteraceae bacterium]